MMLQLLSPWLDGTLLWRTTALTIIIAAGAATFFIIMFASKALSKRGLKQLIKPKNKQALPIQE